MAFTEGEWNEDIWKGATAGCSLFVGLFQTVAAEEGSDRASEMLQKFGTSMGAHSGEMLKQQLGDQTLDVGKLSELIADFDASFGAKTEIEQQDGCFRMRIHNCPLAAAYEMMGIDRESGKRICEDWGVVLYQNLMNVLAPKGDYELVHFRETWDDFCEERFSPGK